jgi:site-specific DNA-methyltransferase (adenine-specific)
VTPYYQDEAVTILNLDCREAMREMDAESVDAIVTDPPYGLGFMGVKWDTFAKEKGRGPSAKHAFDHVGGNHNPVNSSDSARTKRIENQRFQAWCEDWAAEALRVAKPGAHLLAFGGTRTFHRLACAIEDAGWEIRDTVMWVYGSGFPKSLDVSKAIDREATVTAICQECSGSGKVPLQPIVSPEFQGYAPCKYCAGFGKVSVKVQRVDLGTSPNWRESKRDRESGGQMEVRGENAGRLTAPATDAARQWEGWGTALKPAWEPIIVARKPIEGTVAANVMKYGTGAINVDGCRVHGGASDGGSVSGATALGQGSGWNAHENRETEIDRSMAQGRWPANLIHDGSDEVVGLFPQTTNGGANISQTRKAGSATNIMSGAGLSMASNLAYAGDSGSAARFFYTAKASRDDRSNGNTHPTVKPTDLMRYLCRLVTPPGGIVLDPFMGSGSTGKAAMLEGFEFIGIEREASYHAIAEQRIGRAAAAGHQPSLLP